MKMYRAALLVAWALPSFGALTTVQDTLYTATGAYCSGSVTLAWSTFVAPDGHTVYAGSYTSVIAAEVDGLSVALEPGQYTASYNITPAGCVPAYEQWLVPASGSAVTLAAVRSIVPPTPFARISLGWLSQAAASSGQVIAWNGTQWAPATGVPAPATWGQINGTLSNQTDLASALSGKQATVTAYSTISALSGYPSTFPPTNSGDWAGTWQTYSPSHFLTANQPVAWTGSGDVAGSASGATSLSPTLTLATVNSGPGACGSATVSCVPTTNGKGLVTSQTTATIAPPFSAITGTAAAAQIPTNVRARTIGYAFNGGGSALSTQTSGAIAATFACTLSAWTLTVDAGTATVDVWKIAAGTAIPTVTNTITASATPAIASNTALRSTTLTGWTTAVSANDIFVFDLSAVSGATKATLALECDQ